MKAYKGFNKDMTCRGFQYEEGKTYETDMAKICEEGFHACEAPLDCFNYYSLAESVYHEVELDDVSDERSTDDTKIVGKKIKIGALLSVKDIIKASVNFVFEHAKPTTGNGAHAATTGDWAHAATTGYGAHAATTGYGAHAATTGYGAHAATTGDRAHAATTGNGAHAATTGNGSHAATTGYRAHAATTGDWAHAEAKGKDAVAASLGIESKARGSLGCWLGLSDWRKDNEGVYHLRDVQARRVDGDAIKADTWYQLIDGKFVEVDE